jgi:hypothetical protein
MPWMTIPLASLLVSGAVGGTTAGLAIDQSLNAPSKPPAPSTTPTPLTQGQNQAQQASASGALPTLQSMTGGSVSPEYAAQFGASQSGLSNDPQATGNIQAAINQMFGLTAPGSSGLTPSTSGGGATDILSLLTKAGGGGSPTASGVPGGGDFINSTLSGDAFKGLVGGQ